MRFILLSPVVVLIALLALPGTPAYGQLDWGVNGAGGTGNWDSSTPDWYNGASNGAWVPGDTATFQGTAGTVTVSGTQVARELTFDSSSGTYVVTGGTLEDNGTNLSVEVESGTSATIDSTISGAPGASGDYLVVGDDYDNEYPNNPAPGQGTLTINGTITDGSSTQDAYGVVAQGGTLILNGANSYTGITEIFGTTEYFSQPSPYVTTTVQMGSAGTLGNTKQLFMYGNSVLDLNGTSQAVGDLAADSTYGDNQIIENDKSGTTSTLTIGSGNATQFSYLDGFSGQIIDHASGTGIVAVTKVGTGTEALAGPNTYSGGTTVNGGTLLIENAGTYERYEGSGTGTGNVTVNSGGTLGGFGAISPSAGKTVTIASGGNFAPTGVAKLAQDEITVTGYSYTTPFKITNADTGFPGAVLIFSAPTGPTATIPQITFTLDASQGTATDPVAGLSYLEANEYVSVVANVGHDVQFNGNLLQLNDATGGQLALGNYLLFSAEIAADYAGLTVNATTGQITGGLTIADSSGEFAGDELYEQRGDIYLDVVSIPEPSAAWFMLLGSVALVAVRRVSLRRTPQVPGRLV